MIYAKISPYIYAGLGQSAQRHIRTGAQIDRDELHIIADVCCDEYDLAPSQFRSRSKTACLSDARKSFFHLCRKELYTFTCKRLGMYLGRDHSTVVHAVMRAQELLEIDPTFRAKHINIRQIARQRLDLNGYSYIGSKNFYES